MHPIISKYSKLSICIGAYKSMKKHLTSNYEHKKELKKTDGKMICTVIGVSTGTIKVLGNTNPCNV